ncbi:DUF167 domain-containing protein [Caldimonas brevitalea]|uniref:UPF0235 protein AAW51_1054 n=1 Tax=Caldimonas brevitalea TaxID=413882 RepID=A0A0G3BMG6_9BURK|nr:DUF167 domain-containing protein [Caldimonas brevitalea]AKJ27745.1 hypothetical protein AAW51_1054 [Caldimonas brevitalea]
MDPVLPAYLRRSRRGLEIDVSVVPNASRTQCVGLHDGALRVRLQAPPVDGKANEALLRWVAERLGLPRGQVELLRGQTSRRKTVLACCPDDEALANAMQRLAPEG